MKIVGCDLLARQQTIAMVDTETGEFTAKTLPMKGMQYERFVQPWKVRWWWRASRLRDQCSGSWNCWKSGESNASCTSFLEEAIVQVG